MLEAFVDEVAAPPGLRTNIRNVMKRVIIIVDIGLIGSASFPQLSDYVAMVALAQTDMDVDLRSYPTVLNLFAEGGSEPELTTWDVDYLAALYAAPVDRLRASSQQRAMAQTTLKRRRERDRTRRMTIEAVVAPDKAGVTTLPFHSPCTPATVSCVGSGGNG